MTLAGIFAGVLQQQGGGGGPAFDPLSYGSPFHAFWAEDPNWTNPGDGNAVSSWRNDGSNGVAATQATGANQPLYLSSGINSRPALDFDGSNDRLIISDADTTGLTNPITVVVCASFDSASGSQTFIDGVAASSRVIINTNSSGFWQVSNGGTFSTGVSAVTGTSVHVVVAGTSAKWRRNGTQIATGNSGTNGLDGIAIGSRNDGSQPTNAKIAYVAVFGSDITGEAWFSEYESGLRTLYGV